MHIEVVLIVSYAETLIPPPSAQGTAWRHEAANHIRYQFADNGEIVSGEISFFFHKFSYVLPLVVRTKHNKAINPKQKIMLVSAYRSLVILINGIPATESC